MRARQWGYFTLHELLAWGVILAIGVLIWIVVASWTCAQRWKASGLSTTWGIGQGCLVQTPGGRWIPDDRVRDVDLAPPAADKRPEIPTKPTVVPTT